MNKTNNRPTTLKNKHKGSPIFNLLKFVKRSELPQSLMLVLCAIESLQPVNINNICLMCSLNIHEVRFKRVHKLRLMGLIDQQINEKDITVYSLTHEGEQMLDEFKGSINTILFSAPRKKIVSRW